MNTFNIGLDLDKRPAVPEWVTIRQGDMNGTTIAASIYDHGTLLTGSYDARVCFRLPDGEHYYRKDATFSAGVATVTIDEQEAASVIGNTFGYFEILSGSTVIASTADFGVRVLRSATRVAFTEAIKAIATYWSVPCLYLYGDAFFTSDYWVNGFDGGHPTAPMYAGMAVAINRLLAQCIADNYSYFKTYTGV